MESGCHWSLLIHGPAAKIAFSPGQYVFVNIHFASCYKQQRKHTLTGHSCDLVTKHCGDIVEESKTD